MNKINENNAVNSNNNTLKMTDKVNHNHEKRGFDIGICSKCNAEYKDVKVWYYTVTRGDENKDNNYCSNCWKTEEKNYHHFSDPKKNFIYKVVRIGGKRTIGARYYFENGRWISLDNKTFDDLEQNDKYNNLVAGHSDHSANKASAGSDSKLVAGHSDHSANKASAGSDSKLVAGHSDHSANKASAGSDSKSDDKTTINSLNQYFKSNSIKQISLNSEGNLTIEYEPNKVNEGNNQLTTKNMTLGELLDKQELQETLNYLLENKKDSLSQQELNALANTSAIAPEKSKDNNNLKIGLAIGGGVLVVGVFAYLLTKKHKKNK